MNPFDPVTFTRSDGTTFTVTPKMPASFAARLDLDSMLSVPLPKEMQVRAYAVSLGLTMAGAAPQVTTPEGRTVTLRPMPSYANNGMLREYSAVVVDHLMGAWEVAADDGGMWAAAVRLTTAITESLPTKKGVEAARDFTSASEGA